MLEADFFFKEKIEKTDIVLFYLNLSNFTELEGSSRIKPDIKYSAITNQTTQDGFYRY